MPLTNKEKEDVDEIKNWIVKKKIEDGINAGISKRVRAVCITSTTSLMSGFYFLGCWLYENSKGVYAAINAFIAAMRSGQ